ncbi:Nn.00g035490.m01.CDS01 [Neocucurbitaria sp. VM-36]
MPPEQSSDTSKPKSQITSTDAAAKDAGFDDFRTFLFAYGLRLEEQTHVQEGKALLRAMGYGV